MFSPQYEFTQSQQVTVYKVQDLQVALQKAMQNISQLQANLSFMLKYNQDLKAEQQSEQKRFNRIINQLQLSLNKKQRQITSLREKHADYETILTQTKSALDQCNLTIQQKQQQIQRYQRIIHQQKTTISSLQDDILNSKYNQVSIQSNQTCFLQIEQLQKKNEELQYQNKRLMNNLEKQNKKSLTIQKENVQFKTWLAEMVGVRKVVGGCEKLLMDQITKKLKPNGIIS